MRNQTHIIYLPPWRTSSRQWIQNATSRRGEYVPPLDEPWTRLFAVYERGHRGGYYLAQQKHIVLYFGIGPTISYLSYTLIESLLVFTYMFDVELNDPVQRMTFNPPCYEILDS